MGRWFRVWKDKVYVEVYEGYEIYYMRIYYDKVLFLYWFINLLYKFGKFYSVLCTIGI